MEGGQNAPGRLTLCRAYLMMVGTLGGRLSDWQTLLSSLAVDEGEGAVEGGLRDIPNS